MFKEDEMSPIQGIQNGYSETNSKKWEFLFSRSI